MQYLLDVPYTDLALKWILISPDNRAGVLWIDTLCVSFTCTICWQVYIKVRIQLDLAVYRYS